MAIAVSSLISCGGVGNGTKSTEQVDSTEVADSAFAAIGKVRDLALIFQGGVHRIDWNERQIAPYVTHKFANGTEDWLFDGFLFLEFKDGRGVQLAPGFLSSRTTANSSFPTFACPMHAKMIGNAISTVYSRKANRSTPSTRS